MTRLPEVYGDLQLLLNILSMRVADAAGLGWQCVEELGMNTLNQGSLKCHCLYDILVDRHQNLQAKLMFYFLEKVFLKGLSDSCY